MMDKAKEVRLKLKMPNGEGLKITYVSKWSYSPELKHRVDHFEFRGGVSETGYLSHFAHVALDYMPIKK